MNAVPSIRIRKINAAAVNENGAFVLYWMIAGRRIRYNFALQRAVELSVKLKKPLMIFEALRWDYPWACHRFHTFILDGMRDNAAGMKKYPFIRYFPYVEPGSGAGKGLLPALAASACAVVTDDFPAFFLPNMVTAASQKISVTMEAVDANGMLPLKAADHAYPTAYAFRRFLQKVLPDHLPAAPESDPLEALSPPFPGPVPIPEKIRDRWPDAAGRLKKNSMDLTPLSVSRKIPPAPLKGGNTEAARRLGAFLGRRLSTYDAHRNHPDEDAASGLSPYLHFGHISPHEVFNGVVASEEWFFHHLSETATGSKSGWWGMRPAAEAFLDQLVTWRELGFNMCAFRKDYDRYDSLPDWAKATLAVHERDPRPYIYDIPALEGARTHDPVWNAAQRQLVVEGRIHNYLRMLWGKKILEWSPSPCRALETMIHLNNKYALDGRDPNSYSGIFWCLGRYDRPWGPERSIFGKVRYMSSENTVRKLHLQDYLAAWGPEKTAP